MTFQLREKFQKPAAWRSGTIQNSRGHPQRYGSLLPENPRAHIVCAQGNGNFDEAFYEIGNDFYQAGCGFHDIDRYGQGLSGRYLSDPSKLHSEGLHRDIDDLALFTRQFVPDDAPKMLFGHSGGALIALLAFMKYPGLWQGLALSAPPLGLKGKIQDKESAFARLPLPRFLKEKYAPDNGPWKPRSDPQSRFKPEDFSSDPDRMMLHDYWQTECADLRIGGATLGMAQELCRGIAETRQPGALEKLKGLKAVFAAGQDVYVNSAAIRPAVERMTDASFHYFDQARHSLPWERDDYRDVVVGETLKLAHNL